MVYDRIPKPPDVPEGWDVRFAQPEDEDGILRVLSEAFPRWPKLEGFVPSIEHLRWKMASHKRVERFHMVVTSPEGIVGTRLLWAFEAQVGDNVYLVREAVDGAVKPAFQRNYAMSALRMFGREALDLNFDMHLGYGSDAPGMRKMRKYRVPESESTHYQRSLDVLVCDLESASRRLDGAEGYEIRPVEVFDERVDDLWSRARSHFLFGVVRSSTYLNWRYADPRAGDYQILAAQEGKQWLGYLVLRASEKTGYIVDLLALPNRMDAVESLLSAALDRFRAVGQRNVECWSETHSVYRWALDNAGFRQPRRSIGLTFRPLSFPAQDAAFLGDPTASILFTAGDTDLV